MKTYKINLCDLNTEKIKNKPQTVPYGNGLSQWSVLIKFKVKRTVWREIRYVKQWYFLRPSLAGHQPAGMSKLAFLFCRTIRDTIARDKNITLSKSSVIKPKLYRTCVRLIIQFIRTRGVFGRSS